MPSVFQLASERLQGSADYRQLRASQVNPNVVRGIGAATRNVPTIRTPNLPIGAADTRFTPAPIPSYIEPGIALGGIGNVADIMTKAAFNFHDRETTTEATNAVTAIRKRTTRLMHGGVAEDGSKIPGYRDDEGDAAKNNFNDTVAKLNEIREEVLMGLSPAARRKATLRAENAYNATFREISLHRAKQAKIANELAMANEGNSIIEDVLPHDKERAWVEYYEHVNKLQNHALKAEKLAEFMGVAFNVIEVQGRDSGKGGADVVKEMREYYDAHKEEIPEAARYAIGSKLIEREETIAKEMEASRKATLIKARTVESREGDQKVLHMMDSGEAGGGLLEDYRQGLVALNNGDTDKVDKQIASHIMKAAFTASRMVGPEYADTMLKNVEKSAAEGVFKIDPYYLAKIKEFREVKLMKMYEEEETRKGNDWKETVHSTIRNLETPKEVEAQREELLQNPALTAKEYDFINSTADNFIKRKTDRVSSPKQLDQRRNRKNLVEEGEEIGWSPAFEDKVWEMYKAGDITDGGRSEAIKAAHDTSKGKVNPTYNVLKGKVKQEIERNPHYWDPIAEVAMPKNMTTALRSEQIEKAQEAFGMEEEEANNQVVRWYIDQAKEWHQLENNKDKSIDLWFEEIYNQHPAIKASKKTMLMGTFFLPPSEYHRRLTEETKPKKQYVPIDERTAVKSSHKSSY